VIKTPLVTVIITHHLSDNEKYLTLCLESLMMSEGVDFEAICLSDADTMPAVPEGVRLVWNRDLSTATKKAHHGITLAHPGSKYFLFLSDDVMVSKHMLSEMVGATADLAIIMNPMSNNDNESHFFTNMAIPHPNGKVITLGHQMDYEDLKGSEHLIQNLAPRPPILIPVHYVCFYCTLIPRAVWNMVGQLDERLEVRHNDQDYCIRAKKHGVMSMVHLGVFALHFGSKTLPKVLKPGESEAASEHFYQKHPNQPRAFK